MLTRSSQRKLLGSLRSPQTILCKTRIPRRTLVAAPKAGDGPLMERRPDRELPDVVANRFRWSRTMPIFVAIVACAGLAIFNYQKLSSPVVSGTLYALRTSRKAREYLGDQIYFRHQIPWIRGEMNQLQGRIDIYFTVKGTKGWGTMRFASFREGGPRGLFETTEWSLTTEDGRVIDLLEGGDPLKGIRIDGGFDLDEDEMEEPSTRGFRQMIKK